MKNVKIAESWKVEFHTAFLNVLNHPNFALSIPTWTMRGIG